MTGRWVVAVDGPAGAGKSTVARELAARLGYVYVDTGAMYRALALKALTVGADLRDEDQVYHVLEHSDIALEAKPGGSLAVWLDGREVTAELRTPEVNASVSLVAGFPKIREAMVRRQRELAQGGGVVVDGRDIGTYVLPEADFKFYLTASLDARARRRQRELEALGYRVDLAELSLQIQHRDELDQKRPVAPLRQAADAVVIDTTNLPASAVVREILAIIDGKGRRV
jgi:cytidylate kinase